MEEAASARVNELALDKIVKEKKIKIKKEIYSRLKSNLVTLSLIFLPHTSHSLLLPHPCV
jgi:hypothetical protein